MLMEEERELQKQISGKKDDDKAVDSIVRMNEIHERLDHVKNIYEQIYVYIIVI